jgi:hypothetical protein
MKSNLRWSIVAAPLALMACSNAEGPKTASATPVAKPAEKVPAPFPSTYKAYPGVATAIRNVTVYDGEGGKIDNGVVFTPIWVTTPLHRLRRIAMATKPLRQRHPKYGPNTAYGRKTPVSAVRSPMAA